VLPNIKDNANPAPLHLNHLYVWHHQRLAARLQAELYVLMHFFVLAD